MKRTESALSVAVAVLVVMVLVPEAAGEPASKPVPVGVAKRDITPSYPVFLTGYSSRKTELEGVAAFQKSSGRWKFKDSCHWNLRKLRQFNRL